MISSNRDTLWENTSHDSHVTIIRSCEGHVMCHLMRRGVSTTSVFIMSLYLFFRRTILQKQELKTPERNRFFKLVLPDELDWPDDGQ